MKKPTSVAMLEELGRVRLSASFFMRDFLYSEVASLHGIANIPDDPDLAIAAGQKLCEELLEPLNATFGRVAVRSGYRSSELNAFCNEMQKKGRKGYSCAANDRNHARHIWDRRDAEGGMGATACVVVPWFAERFQAGADWRALAYWIHNHLPYSELQFFPKLAAFNINWHETPRRMIASYMEPAGKLVSGSGPDPSFAKWYEGFPPFRGAIELSQTPG